MGNAMPKITPTGWARIGLYGVAVLVGLASALAPDVGFGHLSESLASVSGLLLVLTGGTATFNVPKADDQQRPRVARVEHEAPPELGFSVYHQPRG